MRVVVDSKLILPIMDSLSAIVNEASLRFSKEGVELVAIDPAHVLLMRLKLGAAAFNEYVVDEETTFGFNTQYLSKTLDSARPKDVVLIESLDSGDYLVRVEGNIVRENVVRNLEVASQEIPEINLQFDVSALVSAQEFRRAFDRITTVSETVIITAKEDGIFLRAEGETEMEIQLLKGSKSLKNLEMAKESTSSYDANYLRDALELSKVATDMELKFSSEKPLQLDFPLGGDGKVTFLLAPKL